MYPSYLDSIEVNSKAVSKASLCDRKYWTGYKPT